jgi:hypothetical protein
MRAGTNQVQVVPVDLVYHEPIGFQVTVAVVFPFTGKWVVFVVGWERAALTQQQDQLAQLRHIFAAPPR